MNKLTTEHTPDNIIASWLDDHQEELVNTADYIFHHPELAYQETLSSKCLADYLENQGFKITWKTAGIDTAFTAVWGGGKPILGFLAEYDALAGVGHACGHNLLGTAVAAAACALKADIETTGAAGTICVYGCPAEEIMSGKIVMNDQGVFDDLDVAITWHPFDRNRVSNDIWQAQDIKNYTFHGLSSHAAKAPEKGRSALDAAELMNVGCNYLREHMIPEARIHYAYIDAGGTAPNVVQDHAVIRYEVRSPWVSQVKDLFERVKNVARGASLMTEPTVDCERAMAFTEYIPNTALAAVADECMKEVGAPKWDEDDYAMAREFLNTYPPVTMENIKSQIIEVFGEDRLEEILERPLDSEIHPFNPDKIKLTAGSTDVGDVGYAAPTLNINIATACIGNVGHSWQMVAQTCSPLAHKGLLTAAKVMALACVRTMDRPDVIEAAKKEVTKRNGGHYTCPLPDSVMPPLDTY